MELKVINVKFDHEILTFKVKFSEFAAEISDPAFFKALFQEKLLFRQENFESVKEMAPPASKSS